MCLGRQYKVKVPFVVEGRSENKLLLFCSTEFEAWSAASWSGDRRPRREAWKSTKKLSGCSRNRPSSRQPLMCKQKPTTSSS